MITPSSCSALTCRAQAVALAAKHFFVRCVDERADHPAEHWTAVMTELGKSGADPAAYPRWGERVLTSSEAFLEKALADVMCDAKFLRLKGVIDELVRNRIVAMMTSMPMLSVTVGEPMFSDHMTAAVVYATDVALRLFQRFTILPGDSPPAEWISKAIPDPDVRDKLLDLTLPHLPSAMRAPRARP